MRVTLAHRDPSLLNRFGRGLAISLTALVIGAGAQFALSASTCNTLDAQPDLEHDIQREAGFNPDYTEGVRAFMEKRKPNFTGRK
jgi:enoyl-CoA hydratase/carnithine racemase